MHQSKANTADRAAVALSVAGLREIALHAGSADAQRAYWREVALCGVAAGMPDLDFATPSPGTECYSRLRWGDADGVHFLDGATSLPLRQSSTVDMPGEAIVIGSLRHGQLHITHGRDERTVINPGTLFLSDYGQRMDMHWTPHNFLFLVLPRRLVTAAIGRHAEFRARTVYLMPQNGLGPVLWAQLCALADGSFMLQPDEWPVALAASAELALGLLRRSFGVDARCPPRTHGNLLYAAQRYIQQRFDTPDLTADRIASAVGCSRTQLYRIFATNGRTVGDYLRDVRLSHARSALEAGTDGGSLGALAFQCGYSDLSAFGKAFRRRFGASPSEWRTRRGL